MNKTYIPKVNKKQKWYLINANNQTLGRLSSKIANLVTGKNRASYAPHIISPEYFIITNSQYIVVSGKKTHQKLYIRHSGRPGGLKEETFEKLQKRRPNRIIEKAIKGMLPKHSLGRKLFTHIKVYSTEKHPYKKQKPQEILLD